MIKIFKNYKLKKEIRRYISLREKYHALCNTELFDNGCTVHYRTLLCMVSGYQNKVNNLVKEL